MARSTVNGRRIAVTASFCEDDLAALEECVEECTKAAAALFRPDKLDGDPEGPSVDVTGILEGDHDIDDIEKQFRIIAQAVPSLEAKAHIGAQWESKWCVATLSLQDGIVTVGSPETDEVYPN